MDEAGWGRRAGWLGPAARVQFSVPAPYLRTTGVELREMIDIYRYPGIRTAAACEMNTPVAVAACSININRWFGLMATAVDWRGVTGVYLNKSAFHFTPGYTWYY